MEEINRLARLEGPRLDTMICMPCSTVTWDTLILQQTTTYGTATDTGVASLITGLDQDCQSSSKLVFVAS
eukprot:88349-Rhodomonas_salina.2